MFTTFSFSALQQTELRALESVRLASMLNDQLIVIVLPQDKENREAFAGMLSSKREQALCYFDKVIAANRYQMELKGQQQQKALPPFMPPLIYAIEDPSAKECATPFPSYRSKLISQLVKH